MQNDIVLLILNCKKYASKAEFQRKTWLAQIEESTRQAGSGATITYYHIIGQSDISTPYLFDHSNNTLIVKTKDDYCSLPAKIIAAIAAVNDTFRYKYIFKTDDDQILLNNNFMGMFYKLMEAKGAHYGGYSLNVPDHFSTYKLVHNELPERLFLEKNTYCNGRFYALSTAAVADLLKSREKIAEKIIEDHAIGLFLSPIYKEGLIHFDSNKVLIDVEKFIVSMRN